MQITKETLSNRILTPQSVMESIMTTSTEYKITKDDMSHATWYYIDDLNGNYVTSQFYWNDGSYNAAGIHSLFDEYGFNLAK